MRDRIYRGDKTISSARLSNFLTALDPTLFKNRSMPMIDVSRGAHSHQMKSFTPRVDGVVSAESGVFQIANCEQSLKGILKESSALDSIHRLVKYPKMALTLQQLRPMQK